MVPANPAAVPRNLGPAARSDQHAATRVPAPHASRALPTAKAPQKSLNLQLAAGAHAHGANRTTPRPSPKRQAKPTQETAHSHERESPSRASACACSPSRIVPTQDSRIAPGAAQQKRSFSRRHSLVVGQLARDEIPDPLPPAKTKGGVSYSRQLAAHEAPHHPHGPNRHGARRHHKQRIIRTSSAPMFHKAQTQPVPLVVDVESRRADVYGCHKTCKATTGKSLRSFKRHLHLPARLMSF